MTLATNSILISTDEALSLLETVLHNSEAEDVTVTLNNTQESLTRFSENQISQNLTTTQFNLSITSYFGKRCATSSTNELNPDTLIATIRRSEELARVAPEDPEWVPLLEPQTYDHRIPAFDPETAHLSPLRRGEIVHKVCQLSAKSNVEASGTLSSEAVLYAVANSRGLRACNRLTVADFSVTARIETGSAWTQRTACSVNQLPTEALTETIINRALLSRNPREVSPGIYPVIFDGAAFTDLLEWVIWNLDARAADEGRSFMSRTNSEGKPIGNRIGEQLFSPLIQVKRNPAYSLLQGSTFFYDGMKKDQLDIIKDGIPQTLSYSRYWAKKQGKTSQGGLFPIVMSGSNQSLEDLISQTEQGILVSRAWYVRYVNPRTLEVTGMTRDGTFWIEQGKIAYPIKNLRFNQCLPDLLNQVEALSSVERYGNTVVPGVKVKAFNFSSITDSV
ncbi:TldD/PmbA family protein [Planktothrix sp. FACHB-1365]|uniref:TldD/PmbA family protein n=1 Tax=Planktothrix sp. FACHB-1365 TaxID=2692855 RepID=UPI001683646B|nr:TldD/PmbA family protein [Planktothrix sp. FACHB-1365]MBD2480762.1 TldD/PmbA family protein [Planktothrix sp. FACHB-1365]